MSKRKQVILTGETNAGKSALFNALLGQAQAIVSHIPGTTTDSVKKAMELLPFGPVTLVDTAGLYDGSGLGAAREKKARSWFDIADAAVYVIDPSRFNRARFDEMISLMKTKELPFIIALSKADLYGNELRENVLSEAVSAGKVIPVSVSSEASVGELRSALADLLQAQTKREESLIKGLLPSGSVALLIAPIDSAAPAGRLILPQVQFIRDCLDNGIRCHVTTPEQLAFALDDLAHVDLAVTDSQAFGAAAKILPADMPLTSFSILTARQKGGLSVLYAGAKAAKELRPGSHVLIAEACTHNTSHEDIGKVKLPRALEKLAGGKLEFDFTAGNEFPENLSGYDLVVHCGGCMLTRRAFTARQRAAENMDGHSAVPFTNYGMVLALAAGVLDRGMACCNRTIYARDGLVEN